MKKFLAVLAFALASCGGGDTSVVFFRSNFAADVSTEGGAFFVVIRNDGSTAFASNLAVHSSPDTGELVTPDGFVLVPGISIPPSAEDVRISSDGTVRAIDSSTGSGAPVTLGRITAAKFKNPSALYLAPGANLYTETVTSGSPQYGVFGQEGYAPLEAVAREDGRELGS